MPCYSPLTAYVAHGDIRYKNGVYKSYISFKKEDENCKEIKIPCGQCLGCRLERSRVWAIRCLHEASLYSDNCFITLTYNDDKVPSGSDRNCCKCEIFKRNDRKICSSVPGSLCKADFQRFMKRLRYYFRKNIRYYQCGEYGSKFSRPHFHACLFNFDFPDKKLFTTKNGNKLYSSDILNGIWGAGFALIGDVTFESAAYVARYMLKKVYKNKYDPERLKKYYNGRVPEFTTMSRRPGIGKDWLLKFKSDVFPDGLVTLRGGIKCKVPKYYESIYELTNSKDLIELRYKKEQSIMNDPNNTPERLEIRGEIQRARANLLKRGYENAV